MKKMLLIFILMFTLIINIDASVIKEDSSTYTGDVYIFGSTKFDNNTIITANVAAIAGMNEAKVQLALNVEINEEKLNTYYYSDLTKTWNIIDLETGDLVPLTEEESKIFEENLNIYYVNNIEKTIEFNYEGVIDEDSLKVNNSNIWSCKRMYYV